MKTEVNLPTVVFIMVCNLVCLIFCFSVLLVLEVFKVDFVLMNYQSGICGALIILGWKYPL